MPATLPKCERLSGKTAAPDLIARGRWGRQEHLRYCFAEGSGLEFNRIIVSVPKKLFKRAVKRNLLKRRMREAYRTQKELLATKGVDILFVYSAEGETGTDVLRTEVARALERIDELCRK
ncbi:MAG: ribonuclease P protein component [Bacteroidales bacterium]|nr:ribonuclease P protein component [Bacteroidales bacterium]